MKRTLLVFTIFLLGSSLDARTDLYDRYFDEAGQHYNIPPLLLKKIATIESGINPRALNHNANGTLDYGLMQINSSHLRELSQWGINESNILIQKVNIMLKLAAFSTY
jgi:soluble lytic murein transglycosylase-like protein